MARISLLLFLAVVIAIGSVSAHPPKKIKKNICPPTLSQLQTFSSNEISKLIEKKIKTAPKTPQFRALFAICRAYSDYLAVFKVTALKSVSKMVRGRQAMMTNAMSAAQAAVGVESDDVLSFNLGKSYGAMANGFVELEEMIAEISASYKFDAKAEISKVDRVKIDKCLVKLKGSINVFVKVISECSARFSGKPMGNGAGFFGGLFKKGVQFGGNLIGAGGKGRGKVGAKVRGGVGGLFAGNMGLGGEVEYDASGKAHVSGGGEFKTLSYPRNKHLD